MKTIKCETCDKATLQEERPETTRADGTVVLYAYYCTECSNKNFDL